MQRDLVEQVAPGAADAILQVRDALERLGLERRTMP